MGLSKIDPSIDVAVTCDKYSAALNQGPSTFGDRHLIIHTRELRRSVNHFLYSHATFKLSRCGRLLQGNRKIKCIGSRILRII